MIRETDCAIRLASLDDAAAIAGLTGQLGYVVDVAAVRTRLSRILGRADACFLVAEAGGMPIGWLHASIWDYIELEPFAVVGGLVVDAAHRGRGVGRRLMAEGERWAQAQGCAIVRLWSSTARTEAHRFYERLGYTRVKTQYAFAKSLDPGARDPFKGLTPRVAGPST
jgi:GNAT superfamily N-acetyltransferase